MKRWYEENKHSMFFFCEMCNCELIHRGKARHFQTTKHIEALKLKEKQEANP